MDGVKVSVDLKTHAAMVVIIKDLVTWREKCKGCDDYMNGDSEKYPGENGAERIDWIADFAKTVIDKL